MRKFINSFYYAVCGIIKAVNAERNMRFHVCIALYVYTFSLFYNFGALEYAILTLTVCGVISLEIVNSAIERLADNPPPGRYHIAGVIKDMAAGAVLVFSIGAVAVGVFLFWDIDVFKRIFMFFILNPMLLLILAVSFVACVLFVFKRN